MSSSRAKRGTGRRFEDQEMLMFRRFLAPLTGLMLLAAMLPLGTIWFGVGDHGAHYLGQNQTTGGTTPAFGSKHDTSNPSGWPNPSPADPNGTAINHPVDHRPAASPANGAPLSAPSPSTH
jgi:hypothetical protein